MKKVQFIFASVFLILLFAQNINAQDKGLGLGLMAGEPTGISGKYWVSSTNAFDFGIAYSFAGSNNSFSLHADYLYHLFNAIETEYTLPVYYGFGARMRTNENSKLGLGARGVIGLALLSDKYPVDFFLEVAPVFQLIPETELNFDIAIGARYYFPESF